MTSPLLALVVAGCAFLLAQRQSWPQWIAPAVGVSVWAPPVGLGLLAAGASLSFVRDRVALRSARSEADAHVGLLARSLLISVSAGMSLVAALQLAVDQVHPLLAAELRTLLGDAQRSGLATSLSSASGRGERLYLLLARAQVTGASTAGTLGAFVDERRDAERTISLEAARKLPVKLTIPLALLILPGFVVLTVGPSVLVAGRQLLGPIIP